MANPLCPQTERERDEARAEVERLREALQDTEADLIVADHEPRKRLARQMTIARGRIREALNGKESP